MREKEVSEEVFAEAANFAVAMSSRNICVATLKINRFPSL
jgi:hypothetical protein